MPALETSLHVAILGFYLGVSGYLLLMSPDTTTNPKLLFYRRFSKRYLTKWTFVVQLVHYLVVVMLHLMNVVPALRKISNKVHNFSDILFTSIVVPVGQLVTLNFWALYCLDRDYVFPKFLDKVIPPWLNHSLHTFNSVLPLIDMIVVKHKFSSWKLSFSIISIYLGAYLYVLIETYYTHGYWLYPIFSKVSYFISAAFCIFAFISALLSHVVARTVASFIWGSSNTTTSKKKIKNKAA